MRSEVDDKHLEDVQPNSSEDLPEPSELQKTSPKDRVGEPKSALLEHLRAGLILDYATFLIAVVTIGFAIFLAGFGYLELSRFKELRKEVAKERVALGKRIKSFKSNLKTQREELATERQALETRVETFKAELEAYGKRLGANQRFLGAVLSHHSNLLVGIVEGFGAALKPDEARRLGSLIFEADAAIDLFHPDDDEVLKALLRLEQIGAHGAVSALIQLRDDKSADREISIRAQQVLTKVVERLKKERQETPPPPGVEVVPPPDEPPISAPESGDPSEPPETGT